MHLRLLAALIATTAGGGWMASAAETLFVIGGTTASGAVSRDVFGFETRSRRWTAFPALAKARACHRAVFVELQAGMGALAVVGGS